MAFQRAPRPDAKVVDGPEIQRQNIKNLLSTISFDKTINRHANYFDYVPLYKNREDSLDLMKYYNDHAVTSSADVVKDNFFHNKEHGVASQLALYSSQ